jgi:OmpA-OmpF porin, OOP family
MNRNHPTLRGLLLAAALLATAGAAQAQAGGYALLGGGRSDFKVDCSGTSACDKSGSALQAIGGYRFGNNWAVEGLYVNFGKATANTAGVGVEVKGTAFGAGGAVFLDLSPTWTLTGRLGLASVKLDGRARLGNIVGDVSDSSANLYTGVAVGYNFSKTLAAELGFLRTRGEIEGDKGDISALTVSARFSF